MKKILFLVMLCALAMATPLTAVATTIVGSEGVSLSYPVSGAMSLVGINSITFSGATTSGGAGGYAIIPAGTVVTGDTTINFCAGCLGGSSGNPFDFTIGSYGTFVATTDVANYSGGSTGLTSSSAFFSISGLFTPAGALAASSVSTADITFAITQSGPLYTGSFSLTSPSAVIPPPSLTPEPSSLALLGTGILGGLGILRRRFKA